MRTGATLNAALIGFGRMGQGYAADPVMARYFRYAAHAQVLRDHPAFRWAAVVDPDPEALRVARTDWSVPAVASTAAGLGDVADAIEIAIIATPPHARLALLDRFANLRAALVEKPVGEDAEQALAFLRVCERRGILVQVNLWRRADERFCKLAAGGLRELIGPPQAAAVFYGNGLLNNGTHMVDFTRMLLGEVASVQRLATSAAFVEGPLRGDVNAAFALGLMDGGTVTFQPLSFNRYRENGLTIWGQRGRFDILNEGLTLRHYRRAANRAMSGEREIACDTPISVDSTAGMALYRIYTNLADAVAGRAPLCSSGRSAMTTARIVDKILGAPASGERVFIGAEGAQ